MTANIIDPIRCQKPCPKLSGCGSAAAMTITLPAAVVYSLPQVTLIVSTAFDCHNTQFSGQMLFPFPRAGN